MTEKPLKKLKIKKKNQNIKQSIAQKQPIQADSDISDSEVSGNAPKIDKKAIKQISTEVTDLLASLKKEHGIEDESAVTTKGKKDKAAEKVNNKNKKEAKNVQKPQPNGANKKAKPGQQPEKKLPAQTKANKKQKLIPSEEGAQKAAEPSVGANQQENSPTKKKKKNKKRAANDANGTNADNDDAGDEPATKKVKPNPNQNQKQGKPKPNAKKPKNDETESAEEAEAKKDHHLKDAVPVFVGNLPTNIKRLKLVKKFKKFGEILSIRFRTNTGKSFLRKAQIEKAPFLIAFIYFDSRAAAEASLVLNGEKIGDNVITVDIDSKDKAVKNPQHTVVIGNLKYAVTDPILREAFECCGEIEHIRIVQSERGCKGIAFIRFAKPESCALALKLNGTPILDREIRVEQFKANKQAKNKKNKNAKNLNASKPGKKSEQKNTGKKPTQLNDTNKQKEQKKKKKNKEFLGLKSNDKKATLNKKNKKKKKLSGEQLLAKKVAPKVKSTTE